MEFAVARERCAQILGHIDRRAVGAEQHLLVQPLILKVDADRAVGVVIKDFFVQPLLDNFFS